MELLNLSLTHCLVLLHQPPSWTLTPFEFCIDEKSAHWNAQTKAAKTKWGWASPCLAKEGLMIWKSRFSEVQICNKSNIPGGNLRPKIWLSFNWPPYKDTFFHQIKLIACIAVTKAAPGRNNWPKENPHLASCDTFVMWLSFLFAGLGANDKWLPNGRSICSNSSSTISSLSISQSKSIIIPLLEGKTKIILFSQIKVIWQNAALGRNNWHIRKSTLGILWPDQHPLCLLQFSVSQFLN